LRARRDRQRPGPQPVRPLAEAGIGRQGKADRVGDGGLVGVRDEGRRDGGVDPHAAATLLEQRQVFVEAVGRIAGRAVAIHQIDEEGQGLLPFGLIELRVPVFVEPARAERIAGHRDEGAALAPARLASQADAVNVVARVVHGFRGRANFLPGRGLGHFHPGGLHQVGAVHDHRAFAVERCGVERAVMAEAVAHGRQDVVDVILLGQVVKRHEPSVGAPDRRFVHADRHDVELAATGGDVRGHALPQHVFFQGDPFDVDPGLRSEPVGVTLHADHVAVVDGGDGDGGLRHCCGAKGAQRRSAQKGANCRCHEFLPK
jgi:hypothetical protein